MNMKNKNRTIVVMSSAGFPSKNGALEMLVSFAQQLWSGTAVNGRERSVVVEREGTVIPNQEK